MTDTPPIPPAPSQVVPFDPGDDLEAARTEAGPDVIPAGTVVVEGGITHVELPELEHPLAGGIDLVSGEAIPDRLTREDPHA